MRWGQREQVPSPGVSPGGLGGMARPAGLAQTLCLRSKGGVLGVLSTRLGNPEGQFEEPWPRKRDLGSRGPSSEVGESGPVWGSWRLSLAGGGEPGVKAVTEAQARRRATCGLSTHFSPLFILFVGRFSLLSARRRTGRQAGDNLEGLKDWKTEAGECKVK